MWFCIKCGKPVEKDKLIRGMCPDCFRKHVRPFKQNPAFKVVMCPRCGSWVNKGEWVPPLPEEEVFTATLMNTLGNYLEDGFSLSNVVVLDYTKLSSNAYLVNAILELIVDGKELTYDTTLKVTVDYKVCPSCIAKAVGKYKYLVQVRFTKPEVPEKLLNAVKQDITTIVSGGAVNVEEVREGINVELEDPVLVKKLLENLVKYYGAKLTSSFKQTGFDAQKGKRLGIITYSTRIPVFAEGDIVIYRNKVAVVKAVDRGRVVLWIPERDVFESVDARSFWEGSLRYPTKIEQEVYVVESVENDVIHLRSASSDTNKRIKLNTTSITLKPGTKVLLVTVDNNIEALIHDIT